MIIDSLEELHLGQGLLAKMIGFLRNPTLSKDSFIKLFSSFGNLGQGKDFLSKSRIPLGNVAKSVAFLPWAMVPGVRGLSWCPASLSGSRGFVLDNWLGGPSQFRNTTHLIFDGGGGPRNGPFG